MCKVYLTFTAIAYNLDLYGVWKSMGRRRESANNADQSGKGEDLDGIHQFPSTKDQLYIYYNIHIYTTYVYIYI